MKNVCAFASDADKRWAAFFQVSPLTYIHVVYMPIGVMHERETREGGRGSERGSEIRVRERERERERGRKAGRERGREGERVRERERIPTRIYREQSL